MKIIDLRTGKTLVDGLSATEITAEMERRIRLACHGSRITPENTEAIVANYKRRGFQPFMFDVAGSADTSKSST